MERSAVMALPEGFVTNTKEIYQEVASYPVVPLEQVWRYWNGKSQLNILSEFIEDQKS